MRELSTEQKDKILNLAKQLDEALDEANCRLLAKNGSCDWSATLLVVPTEVEMGERGIREYNEDGEMQEVEPIDDDDALSLPIECTVFSTETNSLYEEGKCESNYF